MPLVRSADSVLVVVDTQPGFVEREGMGDAERTAAAHTAERIAWLAHIAVLLDVPTVVTEEEPAEEGETLPRVKAFLPADAPVIRKATFALTGCTEAVAAIDATGRRAVVLAGFETDVCVAQSAVGLHDAGHRVVVAGDATYSAGERAVEQGLARMAAAGVEIHATRSLTYEWLETVDAATEIVRRARTAFGGLPWGA
jgi:nicotinamidase-related amidase